MGNRKYLAVKISVCISILFAANFASASFMQSWLKPFQGPGQSLNVLVVTGNYAKSRMLAELIQTYNSQPILLLPAQGSGATDEIFFVPPKKVGRALKIPASEMTNFINFANPKMVLVLGGNEYVSDNYFNKIEDNRTIVRLTGKDWVKTAESAGKLLNMSDLPRDYNKLLSQLDSGTVYRRVTSQPQVTAPEQVQPVIEEEDVFFTVEEADASEK